MSESSLPPSARHLQQQHKLAKDLIRLARAGDPAAIARRRAARRGPRGGVRQLDQARAEC
jgi:hypothetical protein